MDYCEAMGAQARNLRRSARSVIPALDALNLAPWRHGTIGFVGIGASLNAALPAVASLRAAGRRAFAISSGDLLEGTHRALADSWVFVSQSGRSTETVTAAEAASGPSLAITNDPDSPLSSCVQAVLPLDLMSDSPIYTLGYTGTLQAAGMLAEAITGDEPSASRWNELPDVLEDVLEQSEATLGSIDDAFRGIRAIDFVGAGMQEAAAREGALLMREGARMPSAAWSTQEYLHGPNELLHDGILLVAIGGGRVVKLARDAAAAGSTTFLVTPERLNDRDLMIFRMPPVSDTFRPVLEIVPIQALVEALARRSSHVLGDFRHQQPDVKLPAGGALSAPASAADMVNVSRGRPR